MFSQHTKFAATPTTEPATAVCIRRTSGVCAMPNLKDRTPIEPGTEPIGPKPLIILTEPLITLNRGRPTATRRRARSSLGTKSPRSGLSRRVPTNGRAMSDVKDQIRAAAPKVAGRWLGELERLIKLRTAWVDAAISPFGRARRSRPQKIRPAATPAPTPLRNASGVSDAA
jgi:hypothetical protein